MQFHEIILSKPEFRLLKMLDASKREKTFDAAEHFDSLLGFGFAESDFFIQYSGSSQAEYYTITDSGRSYLRYISSQRKRNAAEWIRYGVTTLISVAALIMSIISILMQRS